MKGVFGATPWMPEAKIQKMEPTRGPVVQFVCKISPLSPSPRGAERGDPNVSVSLTVVGLRCSLTRRLTGYHGVGHGCGPGRNLPSRPPASFKGTMVRASTVYEKRQNQNIIHLELDPCRLKQH